MDTTPRRRIDLPTRRRLAVAADVDPRTIDRVILGQPVRGAAGHRARAAIIDAGLGSLIQPPAEERQP